MDQKKKGAVRFSHMREGDVVEVQIEVQTQSSLNPGVQSDDCSFCILSPPWHIWCVQCVAVCLCVVEAAIGRSHL